MALQNLKLAGLLMIEHARTFAIKAHDGQRYGNRPFYVHLDKVAAIVEPYGDVAQSIAYLHDILGGTKINVDEISAIFSPSIANCISLITDAQGENRAIITAKTNARLFNADETFFIALIVKAADRLANMQACIAGKREDLLAVYVSEYSDFKRAVFRDNLCNDIWCELDEIVFSCKV